MTSISLAVSAVQQVAQLQYLERVGVKALAGIVHEHISVFLSQFLKPINDLKFVEERGIVLDSLLIKNIRIVWRLAKREAPILKVVHSLDRLASSAKIMAAFWSTR